MPQLVIENVSKTFSRSGRDVHAVSGVTLTIESGQILGLVGESGCGKSTLSRLIMQLIRPTAGRILLDGTDLTHLPASGIRRHRLDFQMVFQDPYGSLNPRMTVYSTLAEALRQRLPSLPNEEVTSRIAALLEQVGLPASQMRKYPHEFSGGQRQRIAIARALAPEPRLIIADEPVSALDVSIQSQILNLLRDLHQHLRLTLLFISHDLGVVHYLADEIAVMHAGRIVEHGNASNVFHQPAHPYTQRLLAAIPKITA